MSIRKSLSPLTRPSRADLRYAVRTLCTRPAFAVSVVMTLALAMGPTTAIFSAVDALLLRSLPFPRAGQLVRVESVRGGQPGSLVVSAI